MKKTITLQDFTNQINTFIKCLSVLIFFLGLNVNNVTATDYTYNMNNSASLPSGWSKTSRTAFVTYASKTSLQLMGLSAGVVGEVYTTTTYSNVTAISFSGTGSNAISLNLYYSTDNSNWISVSPSVSVSKNTSSYSTYSFSDLSVLSGKVVYLKFQTSASSAYLYSITITAGTPTISTPTLQASEINFTSIGQNGMTANWTNGDGAKRVVIMNTSNSFTDPTDGTDPTANALYSGSGEQVVYNGTGTSVAVTGLTASATYYFRVYEYNGSGSTTKYLTTTDTDNPNGQATTAATSPVVTISGTVNAFANTVLNSSSDEQSYTLQGANLTDVITVTPPAGFEISKSSGSGFVANPSTLTFTSGEIASAQNVYVRFAPTAAQAYSGNITHTSTGATQVDKAVSGTGVYAEPTDHPAGLTATTNSSSQITVTWTDATGGQVPASYLVIASTGTPTTPVDGTVQADGTQLNGEIVKNITQTIQTAVFTGLNASTTYNFSIWPYTNSGAAIDYKTDGAIATSATTETPLGIPVATAGTDVSATGFTANWEAAASATGYDVSVYTGGSFLNETFDAQIGTGGNDGLWSGNGVATITLTNLGAWSLTKVYIADKCLKAGTSSAQGIIITPELGFTGNAKISFRAGAWNAGSESTTLKLAITGGGALGNSSVTLVKGQFSNYEVTITGATATSKISFSGQNAKDSRFFLDDVKVESINHIEGSPFAVTETSKTVSGLNPGTEYFYTVVAKNATESSATSNEISVTTDNSIVVNSAVNASALADCATCNVTVANTGTFTIDAAKTYNSITVESGGKLNTTAPLTVGNLILKAVKDESSFSSIIDATITATSAKLFKTIDDTKWYYMAFPCDVTVADITKSNGESIGVLGTDWFIKYYDGEQRGNNGTSQTNWKHIEAIPTLTANRGYIFGLKTGTVELSIPLNSSVLAAESTDKNIAVAANKGAAANTNHGWNLIGHPYMSKYNAQSNASAPDYMIMPNSDGKTYSQTSKVAGTLPADLKPFAAYFVQVEAAGNIGFGRNGRQNVPASVAAEVSENIRLNLTTATGADDTYLIMDNDQSTEYQIGQDMVKWLGTGTDVPQVYTLIGDVSYAFNALPMASVVNLPIGLYTKNAGASTISVNALQAPSLSKLLLTDKKENITTDLLVSDYSFNATAGSDNTRFVMSAQRISTGDQINLLDAPSVISSNGKLIINKLSPKTNIRIYDATGRLVMSKVAMERSIEIPLQVVGMYAVHIDAGIKNWTIKIVNNK